MARQPVVTLLTDFGTSDPYVAAMKGVLLSRCPRARIVDISHDIPAHNVLAGAVVLAEASLHFPPGTLHVVVVDPGVGTDRRILAAQCGEQLYLLPDNGVITMVAEAAPIEALVVVRNTDLVGGASMTFHGRDVFAPLAAELLNGRPLEQLGPQPDSYRQLEVPVPVRSGEAVVGQVIYVDQFGNLVSNITWQDVETIWRDPATVRVSCLGRDLGSLQGTYGFAPRGELLALVNSMGRIEVAVNRGRACDVLDAGVGTEVRLVQS